MTQKLGKLRIGKNAEDRREFMEAQKEGDWSGINEDGERVSVSVWDGGMEVRTHQYNGWTRVNYYDGDGDSDGETFDGRHDFYTKLTLAQREQFIAEFINNEMEMLSDATVDERIELMGTDDMATISLQLLQYAEGIRTVEQLEAGHSDGYTHIYETEDEEESV